MDAAEYSFENDDGDDGDDDDAASDDEESDSDESVESARMVKSVKKGRVPNDPYLPAHVSSAVRQAVSRHARPVRQWLTTFVLPVAGTRVLPRR